MQKPSTVTVGGERDSAQFTRYPNYRDSEFRWFPKIPRHWEVSTLGRLGAISGSGIDKKTREDDTAVRMVNYTDVYGNRTREIHGSDHLMKTTAPHKKAEEHSLQRGDVLFTPSSETRDEIGMSAVVTEDLPDTVYSYHLTRFRPWVNLDNSFKKYFANNDAVLSYFESVAQGTTRMTLTQGDFKRAPVVLPPFSEQKRIGEFLDQKTTEIDELIDKKERLIELLQEKRTSLITRAVTKGLDPDVPMKKSGVDWLGQVPSHWDLAPLKATIRDWKGGKWGHDPDGNDELVCLRVEDFDRFEGVINMNDPTVRSLEPRYREGRRLENGDLLLEKSGGGDKQPVGFAVLVKGLEEEAICSNFVARLSVRDEMSSSFLRYLLYHLYHTRVNTRSIKQTTGIQNLDVSHYLSTRVAVPPPSEQEAIAGRLEDQTHQIQEVVSKIESAVSRLKEYRTSMITAAVTGKIDVRDQAA